MDIPNENTMDCSVICGDITPNRRDAQKEDDQIDSTRDAFSQPPQVGKVSAVHGQQKSKSAKINVERNLK